LIFSRLASVAASSSSRLRAQLGEFRIATGHQALARIVRRIQFEQIALIEQVQLQLPLLNKRADRYALERRDPGDALAVAHLVDGFVGDHAAVPHHHQLLDAEVLAQALELGHQGLAVGHIALVHRHRHRATARIGEQAVVDLQHAVAAVAESRL
jgi:hypothetical protein